MNNKNIFCASNPAKLPDALMSVMTDGFDGSDFSNDIIFLPSRRAVRAVEQMLVRHAKNGALILPRLIALGEGDDDPSSQGEAVVEPDVISNLERIIILAKLLTAQMDGGLVSSLPVARDLVRMMDYLENERAENAPDLDIDWAKLIGDGYAMHFTAKAKFLNMALKILPSVFAGRVTTTQKRNTDIRAWINKFGGASQSTGLGGSKYSRIFVCGSTASVPATSDLMGAIAAMPNGYIILPGKINAETSVLSFQESATCDGTKQKSEITNPYFSINKFLEKINVIPDDVKMIDVGESAIDFFNYAFFNNSQFSILNSQFYNFTRIDCAREAEEAAVVAEIAANAAAQNKSVLIVTPDVAANMRIAESLKFIGIDYDTSAGVSGLGTPLGRFILELFKSNPGKIEQEFSKNLFNTIKNIIQKINVNFDPTNDASTAVWDAVRDVSDIILNNGLELTINDIGAIVDMAVSGVSVRPAMKDNGFVSILGTIESRMCSADVVILTGLSEGMFPANGYENPWLPRRVSAALGLPDAGRKVSLMAMDFITLSCGAEVYWTRSKMSGGGEMIESRFLSRVSVASAKMNKIKIHDGAEFLNAVRARDDILFNPIDISAPMPVAIYDTVYVTELELLIHNPYAFYCRHILRLYPKDDPWEPVGAREFGKMVHSVIENLNADITEKQIIELLDMRAREVLEPGSILFHFWNKRFKDMAPKIMEMINESNGANWIGVETSGACEIAGRSVQAKADRTWAHGISGVVLDIKTGTAPNKRQLILGNMPQLPIEAYMLQNAGFGYNRAVANVSLQFLQLKNNNVRIIKYADEDVRIMIENSIQKISELFGQYSKDFAPYEYYETSDEKYKAYDDLARYE